MFQVGDHVLAAIGRKDVLGGQVLWPGRVAQTGRWRSTFIYELGSTECVKRVRNSKLYPAERAS